MYLKGVEINGFKSFGDKINIDFGKGLTSIVGPNGSGKSNIMDAVLWVLGEQSYKNIRAKDSSDVIFSGNGKNNNHAEVSIFIDNNDGYFSQFQEVVKITRKIYSSGENEYLINDKKSRLKDISSLFMDTGIGKSAYSVIGQGKVERIISSSNKEIKGIIEEAAGIKKIQVKKQESLKNLENLQGELEKIELLVNQVGESRSNIEKQSIKAREFLKLKSEKESLEKGILKYELEENRQVIETLENSLKNSEIEKKKLEENIAENENSFEKNEEEREILQEKVNEFTEKNDTLREKIEAGEREKAVSEERINSFEREKVQKSQYIGKIQEKITGINETLNFLAEEKSKYSEKIIEFEEHSNIFSTEIDKVEKEKRVTEIEIEGKKRKTLELEVERLKVVNEIETSERRAKSSNVKIKNLESDMNQQKDILAETEKKIVQFSQEKDRLQKNLKITQSKISEIENLISEKSIEANIISEKIRNNDYEVKRATVKLQNLIRIEESNEGLFKGVKEVLNEKIPGVYGIVANIINIPDGLERAIEAAIPGNLQDIVTDTGETARKGIEILKQKKVGRASFLALDTIKISTPKKVPLESQIVGIASELIGTAPQFKRITDFLLGNILIVETVEKGLEILKRGIHQGSIVTLTGELFSSRGRITGGENQTSTLSNIIERKKERKTLSDYLEKISSEQKKLAENSEVLKNQLEKLENDIIKADSDEELYRKDLKRSSDDLEGELLKQEKVKRELEIIFSDYSEEKAYIEEFNKKIGNSIDEKITSEETLERLKKEILLLQSRENELAEKIKIKREEFSDIKILHMNCSDRIQQISDEEAKNFREISGLEKERENENSILLTLEKNIQENIRKISEISQEIKLGTELFLRENEEINRMKNRISILSSEERTLISQRKNIETQHLKISDTLIKLIEQCEKLKNEIQRKASEYESLSSVEELEIIKENYSESREKFKKLDTKLKNFETVNLLSIDEFELLDNKYQVLKSQYADMEESKSKLLSLIKDIEIEIENRFKEAYFEINENFAVMCRDVLHNSEGKLLLTQGESLEESGIDIVVRYRNKKHQSLSLFSGGEKSMVAIAFIMSIFMYKPSPFTFLDEIEAALDEKNTRKLIGKLKEFTDRSQFILITHNKETMKESDSIFGVTMNKEIGISKIVPVKF